LKSYCENQGVKHKTLATVLVQFIFQAKQEFWIRVEKLPNCCVLGMKNELIKTAVALCSPQPVIHLGNLLAKGLRQTWAPALALPFLALDLGQAM
jgi:hypothetical protein